MQEVTAPAVQSDLADDSETFCATGELVNVDRAAPRDVSGMRAAAPQNVVVAARGGLGSLSRLPRHGEDDRRAAPTKPGSTDG